MNITYGSEEMLEKIRPKHPDFDRMCVAVNKNDIEVEDDKFEQYLIERSGMPADQISQMALDSGFSLLSFYVDSSREPECRIDSFQQCYRMGWAAGFYEARCKITGINYMESDPDGKGPDFCGVDSKSFKYVADQRVLRMVQSVAKADIPMETSARSIAIMIASCWMDGYFTAVNY